MSLKEMSRNELENSASMASENPISFDGPRSPSLLRRVVEKIRLLPMVIFFSTLMLTVRVVDIWNSVDGVFNKTLTVSGSPALAQSAAGSPPAATPVTPGAAAMPKGNELGGGLVMGGSAPMMAKQDRGAIAARMLADDPTLLTQSEIDLLQQLAERRVIIDARAKELESRAVLLAAAETRINIKIKEFKALKATIEALVVTYDGQQLTKLKSLVKIYEKMKPKDAARILEELDMGTLLPIAELMKERSISAILAKMNRQRARDITVELNQLRKLPTPIALGG